MQADLSVREALGLAMLRKVQRLAAIHDELDEIGAACCITASDLYLLESQGFIVDFDTFRAIDTLAAVDAEAVPA